MSENYHNESEWLIQQTSVYPMDSNLRTRAKKIIKQGSIWGLQEFTQLIIRSVKKG